MKRIRFVMLCSLLAATLVGCGEAPVQDVPTATAAPAPTSVPVESSVSAPEETPVPTPAADIGKEYDDLSSLNDDQRQVYELAERLSSSLYGLPDNLVGDGLRPRFTQQADSDGVFVLVVDNYALYENPYTDFTDLMQSVFTADFIRKLGPLYTEKFIDLDGKLATSCDSTLWVPMHNDLSRTVMDNCPDTYRLESVTDDAVAFRLISHYDKNWASALTPDGMDVYTIEYPIRLVRTTDGWRVDEFYTTYFGYVDAENEPPLSERDLQIPAPEFLTEEQQRLYRRAYKLMLVRAGTYIIDDTQYFPYTAPGTTHTQADTITLDGYDYTPALNRYRDWGVFYSALRSCFTADFLDFVYLSSDGVTYFRPVNGNMYYLPTERGFAAGYDQDTTTMTFTKLEETDDQIVIQVTAVYATDDTGSPAFRQAVQDGLVSDTDAYDITLVRDGTGWRFAQFEVPF